MFDPEPVTVQDLSSQVSGVFMPLMPEFKFFQFFLRLEDVGKPRAEATLPRLAELNAYVPVHNLGGKPGQEVTVGLIQGFQVSTTCIIWSLVG